VKEEKKTTQKHNNTNVSIDLFFIAARQQQSANNDNNCRGRMYLFSFYVKQNGEEASSAAETNEIYLMTLIRMPRS